GPGPAPDADLPAGVRDEHSGQPEPGEHHRPEPSPGDEGRGRADLCRPAGPTGCRHPAEPPRGGLARLGVDEVVPLGASLLPAAPCGPGRGERTAEEWDDRAVDVIPDEDGPRPPTLRQTAHREIATRAHERRIRPERGEQVERGV